MGTGLPDGLSHHTPGGCSPFVARWSPFFDLRNHLGQPLLLLQRPTQFKECSAERVVWVDEMLLDFHAPGEVGDVVERADLP